VIAEERVIQMMLPKAKRVRLHGDKLREVVAEVYKRDGGHCIICGAPVDEGEKPHHYPQGALKSDEVGKMVVLCMKCHTLVHFGTHGEPVTYKKKVKDYLRRVNRG